MVCSLRLCLLAQVKTAVTWHIQSVYGCKAQVAERL
jgi:hypothetical protein